jgi:RimJ/RimL family protein N-acetyltransferase
MTETKTAPLVVLRPVTVKDARSLFQWANDPRTRHNSLSQEPITEQRHLAWLSSRIDDSKAHSFIARADYSDIGIVSVDYRPAVLAKSSSCNAGTANHARVSITVAPLHRGCGYAVPMLRALCHRAKRMGLKTLEAIVKRDNEPSLSAFRDCGFWVSHQQSRGHLWTFDYRL